jgi:hypothetical protein
MKSFLAVNFVFVFLILTASYVTDFILKWCDLTAPHSRDEIIASTVIRVGYLAVLVIGWLWFRFSWKKKYVASLDPETQAAMNDGRGVGKRISVILLVGWIVYIVWKYVLKM